MKKAIFLALAIIAFSMTSLSAQTAKFIATNTCYKTRSDSYSNWSNWTDWSKTSILVAMSDDKIKIMASSPLTLDVFKSEKVQQQSVDGDIESKFWALDQDNRTVSIRLIERKSGSFQIYVDYANAMYCYQIVPKN